MSSTIFLDENLSQISLLGIYAAMLFYAGAFVVFALNLSRLASENKSVRESASKLEVTGLILMWLALAGHAFGVIGRGIAANRVPWANMYEFSITGTIVAALIFMVVQQFKAEIRYLGTFIAGFVTLVLGIATTVFYIHVKSLMPALQDYWLVIHVSVAILGTAFFNIAAALSITYLFKTAKWVNEPKGALAKSPAVKLVKRVLELFPTEKRLEQLSYRFNIIGFILWTFTLIAGAIWAERAWHRYWGWDTKEVWTFIIWTIYAGYLHANATRGWNGKRSAWLVVVGFSAIIFNFTIVNLFFKGLHVYSGL
ncbi:MAG: c-type cytochrome biosis protein CcsB [Actinomycetota bacterium]|jgi:cytochrome c-type biogenesis protein CcsB